MYFLFEHAYNVSYSASSHVMWGKDTWRAVQVWRGNEWSAVETVDARHANENTLQTAEREYKMNSSEETSLIDPSKTENITSDSINATADWRLFLSTPLFQV